MEVGRLTLIRSARFQAVVRPDWDIQLLLPVPIIVAQEKTVASVRIPEPTFKRAGDA